MADAAGGRGPQAGLLQVSRAAPRTRSISGGDVTRATNSWEAPEIGRPGALTFGLNATRGLYAGWGGCAPRGARGFPVYRPEHWAFAGTGLYYGDVLGGESHVFGYEVDGLDYVIRNGLPEPTPDAGAPDGLQVLALGMSSLVEESADVPLADRFLTDEDGRFVAETLFGTPSDDNLEKVKRGCGMIVTFPRGRGRGLSRRQLRMGGGAAAPRRDGRDGDEERAGPVSRAAAASDMAGAIA